VPTPAEGGDVIVVFRNSAGFVAEVSHKKNRQEEVGFELKARKYSL
jgi:hypothetical protein